MSEDKKEQDAAPSTNPEERPDLQDYKSTDKEPSNTNTCQDCGKVFSSIGELTAHYKKDHPESF
jgi:C2H2 type zinc finger protein